MTEKVQAILQEYEDKLNSGSIQAFKIKITDAGMLLQSTPDGVADVYSFALSPELHTTLQIFFSGIDAIDYGSYDYTTFKSLLNAHGTLERMNNKSSKPKE